ncbi:HD domain-containing protein [Siphonobacter sp. BAB-5385]|uniref:HD domain-containing protein n=1 Tax=Siphonobacter sp. BAB-5385 TaxID=1864822 RepID=UPI0020CF5CFE|nr:HD domain-containing protein [Siphonobacter sp. BAB-5385]
MRSYFRLYRGTFPCCMNKKKVLNDPVYGFITIPGHLIFDLIEHPYFQRLRRIKQLGIAEYVYPGALHTRFHHALGAMHLMGEAISTLKSKGHLISEQECEAVQIAILLHDIGHGPFSHVLEHTLLHHVSHERISLLLMKELNKEFNGALDLAIRMFSGQYERRFFYDLISSQLDIDRLDYLNRDCFFTGVTEGSIGSERIVKLLDVVDNQLVIEQKGVYSIENFLTARRLMYWQVYLHKTAICAETMLIQLIRRARELVHAGESVYTTPALEMFITNEPTLADFQNHPQYIRAFTQLDDYDIWACIKQWTVHSDRLLAHLSTMLLNRRLFKIRFFDAPPSDEVVNTFQTQVLALPGVTEADLPYLVVRGETTNSAYLASRQPIRILTKDRGVVDVSEASDLPTIKALSQIVRKYYVAYAVRGI